MSGYGKFFPCTFTGSMFGAGLNVFAVWGYVVSNTGPDSLVELNPNMLAAALGCDVQSVNDAIDKLCQPDPKSRNPDYEGRRLIRHEGGDPFTYFVPSKQKYTAIRNDDERKSYNRLAQQKSRAKKKLSTSPSMTVNECQHIVDVDVDVDSKELCVKVARESSGTQSFGVSVGDHTHSRVVKLPNHLHDPKAVGQVQTWLELHKPTSEIQLKQMLGRWRHTFTSPDQLCERIAIAIEKGWDTVRVES